MSRRARGWRAGARTGLALALSAAVVAGGCAKPGPPGGGPPDSEPPTVVGTVPESGALGVDRTAVVEFTFSEDMNRLSVERNLSTAPPIDIGKLAWRGTTLAAEPESALPESTTLVFQIGPLAQDYHGVVMGSPFSLAFSTGASLDRGVIAGEVSAGGDPQPGAVVWACREGAARPDTSGFIRPCGYATVSDPEGRFRFENVKPLAEAYTIVAFVDGDGDRRYWVAAETGATVEGEALIEAPDDSATGLVVPMAPPETTE